MENILIVLAVSIGFNLFMFIPAYLFKTDILTDLSYALSFMMLSGYCVYQNPTPIGLIAFSLIMIWALRLGSYLFRRILKIKKDKRFHTMRKDFLKFFGFWLLQGSTVFIVLLPSIFVIEKGANTLEPRSKFGLAIYAIGLLVETIADHQKYTFKSNLKNKGKWIDTGLWKYSRHPNYLGEILLWIGIYLYAEPYLLYPYTAIGIISPLYIFCLLTFVSGIPMLEKRANEKWGDDPAYQMYKQKTSVLVPFL